MRRNKVFFPHLVMDFSAFGNGNLAFFPHLVMRIWGLLTDSNKNLTAAAAYARRGIEEVNIRDRMASGKIIIEREKMELTEGTQIEMHSGQIGRIFQKNPGRFMTFKDIANAMKEAEWAKFDYIMPALEKLIEQGKLEHDPVYGYCPKGQKAQLRRDMADPPMSRAAFEKLSQAERAQYCESGGRIAG